MKDAKYSVQFNKADRQVNALSAAGIDLSRRNGNVTCFLKNCGVNFPDVYREFGQVYCDSGVLSGPRKEQ